ncbi:MAG: ShlB/FhaC/HecB family hemolysin secretion/activation protein [Alphaproteobacteria bacterium]|nr:ShlB/FhaC/HecB family hemolysin secretion/activation protein [Alphaproteobacteria bacterium]
METYCRDKAGWRGRLVELTLVVALLLPATAFAAEPGRAPAFVPPIQTQPPSSLSGGAPVPATQSGDDLAIPVGGVGSGAAAAPAADFMLAGVAIRGASVFDEAQLALLYREYVGRRIGAAEIAEIVSRITAKYRAAGYFLSHALAARQPSAGGVLDVRVIEGYIDKVTVNAPYDRLGEASQNYAEIVTAERPLRLATLERAVLLIKDLPGIAIAPSVAPIDEAAGRYELVLAIDPQTLSGSFATDNRGPRYEGPWQAEGSLSLASVAVPFDELSGNFFVVPNDPRELAAGGVGYGFPLGASGLRAALAATRSQIHPGDYLAFADLRGVTDTYRASLNYPLLRSRDQSLWFSGSFDTVQSREDTPVGNFFDDRLRVVRGDATYLVVDPLDGNSRVYVQVSQGLSGLGASRLATAMPSTPNGRAEFTKLAASLTHEQPLFGDFAAFVDIAGQKSWQPLLLSEQFSLGGTRFGRGYDPAELLGDDALAGAVELRFGRAVEWGVLRAFQLYLFYDLGEVWNRDPANLVRHASLASAGGGLRLTLAQDLSLSVEIARPLTLPLAPDFDKPVRAFARLSKSF